MFAKLCDTHPEIFVDKINNLIRLNLSRLRKEDPNYNNLEKGGDIIWHNYYKKVRENKITLIECIDQLNSEYNSNSDNSTYIRLYVKHFGHNFIFESKYF